MCQRRRMPAIRRRLETPPFSSAAQCDPSKWSRVSAQQPATPPPPSGPRVVPATKGGPTVVSVSSTAWTTSWWSTARWSPDTSPVVVGVETDTLTTLRTPETTLRSLETTLHSLETTPPTPETTLRTPATTLHSCATSASRTASVPTPSTSRPGNPRPAAPSPRRAPQKRRQETQGHPPWPDQGGPSNR